LNLDAPCATIISMHLAPAVFFSWQSDLPSSTNRGLIEGAIEQAVKELKIKAERSLRVDSDTKDTPGSPNIPGVIFTKIPSSAIFIADVSIIHPHDAQKPEARRCPNPNVLIELGFAVHALGWKRVIMVMNSFFGEPELLPFDLQQHKFPLTYRSAPEDTDRAAIRRPFARQLMARIQEVLESDHDEAERMTQRLDRRSLIYVLGLKDKNVEYFSDDAGKYEYEIQRLLDVGVIFSNLGKGGYAYHWTYIGELARDLCHKRVVQGEGCG
jgi:hypothetical protein